MLTALCRPSAEPLRVRWYALLLKGIRYRLEEVDLGVLVHSAFPANDGATALGQAAIVGR